MSKAEMAAALETGIELAAEAAADGCDLLGFGEMGIRKYHVGERHYGSVGQANKPEKTSLAAAPASTTKASGRKRRAIEQGLALRTTQLTSATGILQCVGGLEIAAMCRFCLGAAANRVPVVTDGFIATAAAAVAVRMCPRWPVDCSRRTDLRSLGTPDCSTMIGQAPLLDLGMRLGEGTGAALAMGIVQAAVAAFREMATFAGAGVSNR